MNAINKIHILMVLTEISLSFFTEDNLIINFFFLFQMYAYFWYEIYLLRQLLITTT